MTSDVELVEEPQLPIQPSRRRTKESIGVLWLCGLSLAAAAALILGSSAAVWGISIGVWLAVSVVWTIFIRAQGDTAALVYHRGQLVFFDEKGRPFRRLNASDTRFYELVVRTGRRSGGSVAVLVIADDRHVLRFQDSSEERTELTERGFIALADAPRWPTVDRAELTTFLDALQVKGVDAQLEPIDEGNWKESKLRTMIDMQRVSSVLFFVYIAIAFIGLIVVVLL